MFHRMLTLTFLPLCVAGVHIRLRAAPPDRSVSLDAPSNTLLGAADDGLYRDADAAFESFDVDTDDASMHSNSSLSFCVFSRIIEQELPYVKSFVAHYIPLGVRKFYFVNNIFTQHAELTKFLKPLADDLSTNIALHSVHVTDADEALNDMELFRHIREDFVVGVDIDEYWVLPDGISSFSSLVEAHPNAIEYRAEWIMVPNDDIHTELHNPYHGFHGPNGKWMAKVAAIEQIALTPHKPMFAKSFVEHESVLNAGDLLHFWGRSFLDQLAKGLGQHLHNRESEDLDEIRVMTSEGKIPERLRMLAFLSNLDRNVIVDVGKDLLTIDHDLEKQIAAELLRSNVSAVEEEAEKIHEVYTAFKGYVAKIMTQDGFPKHPYKGLEKIAPWLERLQESMPPRL